MVVLNAIAAACKRNRDPSLTADGIERRRRRRLATARAERYEQRQRLLAAHANRRKSNDTAASVAALLATPAKQKSERQPTLPRLPKTTLALAPAPKTEPPSDSGWDIAPDWANQVNLAGTWKTTIPIEMGRTKSIELRLRSRFHEPTNRIGHSECCDSVDRTIELTGDGNCIDSAGANNAIEVRAGTWSPKFGKFTLKLHFGQRKTFINSGRAREQSPRNCAWTRHATHPPDIDSSDAQSDCTKENWSGVFTAPDKARVTCCKGDGQQIRSEFTIVQHPDFLPSPSRAMVKGCPFSPRTPRRKTKRRVLSPVKVLPTPRTYKQLIRELRTALPLAVETWALENPTLAPTSLRAPIESKALIIDPESLIATCKSPHDPVRWKVAGRWENFKINGGDIVVRSGGGWQQLGDWLTRNAKPLWRKLDRS